jgi:hypothetical protein
MADSLFEKFAEATHEDFEASDNLSMLVDSLRLLRKPRRSRTRNARNLARPVEQNTTGKNTDNQGASKTGMNVRC